MISQFKYSYVRANDMEMILTAYNKGMVASDKSEAMQYYKDHTQNTETQNWIRSKSDVIRKKEGENNEKNR